MLVLSEAVLNDAAASSEYSDAAKVRRARLEFARDLVADEGMDVRSFKAALHEAADEIVSRCAWRWIRP